METGYFTTVISWFCNAFGYETIPDSTDSSTSEESHLLAGEQEDINSKVTPHTSYSGKAVVFGISIDEVLMIEKNIHLWQGEVPFIAHTLVQGIIDSGGSLPTKRDYLFRTASSKEEIDSLISNFNNGDYNISSYPSVFILSSILKQWVSSLNPPLIRQDLYSRCMTLTLQNCGFGLTDCSPSDNQYINDELSSRCIPNEHLSEIVSQIPLSHTRIMKFFFEFIKKITDGQKKSLNHLITEFTRCFLPESHRSSNSNEKYESIFLYQLLVYITDVWSNTELFDESMIQIDPESESPESSKLTGKSNRINSSYGTIDRMNIGSRMSQLSDQDRLPSVLETRESETDEILGSKEIGGGPDPNPVKEATPSEMKEFWKNKRQQLLPTRDNKRKNSYLHLMKNSMKTSLTAGISRTVGEAVKIPPGANLEDWLAVNVCQFYNAATLIFGICSDWCNEERCPKMMAGKSVEYLWPVKNPITGKSQPRSLTARQYICSLFEWIDIQIKDPRIFPQDTDSKFPQNFVFVVSVIFRRLFRLYAHCYYHHLSHIQRSGAESYLNTSFKHFCSFALEHKLISTDQMLPLRCVINSLIPNSIPPPRYSSSTFVVKE